MKAEIRIGYLTTLYHTSNILRGSGHLKELGVEASWKLFPNGPDMLEAFETGEIDLGYIGLPGEYIDSTMAFVPALREMGYLARDLAKDKVFYSDIIEKVHPGEHHYKRAITATIQ